MVDGDLLIVPVGGSPKGPRPVDFREVKPNGTGIVAFDKKTGKVKYEARRRTRELRQPGRRDDRRQDDRPVLRPRRAGRVRPADRQVDRSAIPWRAKVEESVNAANPVVVGDKVLLTECYGPGAAFLDLKGGKPKEIWTDAEKDRFDRSLACHWNTPIHVDGFVYGSSGRETERRRDAVRRAGDRRREVGRSGGHCAARSCWSTGTSSAWASTGRCR